MPGTLLASFWKCEYGALTAEYALILTIITTGIAIAALDLGDAINAAITDAGGCIDNPTTCGNGGDSGGSGGSGLP